MVRVTGFEPAASWSQTTRATNCATPGYKTTQQSYIAAGSALHKHKTFLMPVYYTTRTGVCQMDLRKKSIKIPQN